MTVGVVGSQDRIGTTTQALQLVLCLKSMDYDVAYVEMGLQGYLNKLKALYQDITESEMCMCYQGIDMYSSGQIVNANKRGYDYLIKDYGNVCDPDFQKVSYLEQDIKIIVGGVKANEIEFVEKILDEKCYGDAKYIFSFVAQDDQQEIKRLMGDHRQDTYFSLYIPDPFTYADNEDYAYILGE